MTPIDGGSWTSRAFVRDYQAASEQDRRIYMNRVSPDYFATIGATLRGGRDFNEHDTVNAPKVAIVNDAFVRKFMRGAQSGRPDVRDARRRPATNARARRCRSSGS